MTEAHLQFISCPSTPLLALLLNSHAQTSRPDPSCIIASSVTPAFWWITVSCLVLMNRVIPDTAPSSNWPPPRHKGFPPPALVVCHVCSVNSCGFSWGCWSLKSNGSISWMFLVPGGTLLMTATNYSLQPVSGTRLSDKIPMRTTHGGNTLLLWPPTDCCRGAGLYRQAFICTAVV